MFRKTTANRIGAGILAAMLAITAGASSAFAWGNGKPPPNHFGHLVQSTIVKHKGFAPGR